MTSPPPPATATPAPPPSAAPLPTALRLAATTPAGAEGMNELNWHWWPAAHAIRSEDVGSLAGCKRMGTCMWGCPEGAKSSTDTTMWPQALAHGAKLITGARVREITTNGKGLATGAIYVDRDGTQQRQQAQVVIGAAKGLCTPHLLIK